MNNDNTELLSGIYKLSQTGMEATKAVLQKTEQTALRSELEEQYNDYSDASAKAEQELVSNGVMPKDLDMLTKAMMWGSIKMNTINDISPEHIAEIMINGTTMGIVDLTKHIGSCTNADENIRNYAKDFIQNEERHIENLKAFLC
ncbi:MAG: hypothetical protein PUG48_00990 [Clostridia bacterium]|nr:hypothetical protein [Clostridia bacterium]